MIDVKEIEKLAELSRIGISNSEKEGFQKEINSILSYVDQIKEASLGASSAKVEFPVKNVLREDADPHGSGVYTDTLLAQVPDCESNQVKVKKIL